MVVHEHKQLRMSADEFDRFVARPEHADRRFEYITGRVVEVTSNFYASKLAMWIGGLITAYLIQNDIGHLTGADGGYMIGGERYIPDVAFIAYAKQQEAITAGYNPLPPDLAIEVISNPSNKQEHEDLRRKVINYLVAGTVVWVFDWSKQQGEVYTPGRPVTVVDKDGVIDGGDVLPGFTLKLADVYKSTPEDS